MSLVDQFVNFEGSEAKAAEDEDQGNRHQRGRLLLVLLNDAFLQVAYTEFDLIKLQTKHN